MSMYDLMVIGLGVYGSAVAAEAAARGLRVVGIDQFVPPHSHGSSHGGSRVLRVTTVEAEEYAPLAKRALELWREYDRLYRERNEDGLITETGFAIIAQRAAAAQVHHGVDRLVERAERIAVRHRIPYESFSGEMLMGRFPGLHIRPCAAEC